MKSILMIIAYSIIATFIIACADVTLQLLLMGCATWFPITFEKILEPLYFLIFWFPMIIYGKFIHISSIPYNEMRMANLLLYWWIIVVSMCAFHKFRDMLQRLRKKRATL
jgi:hypothetical protein